MPTSVTKAVSGAVDLEATEGGNSEDQQRSHPQEAWRCNKLVVPQSGARSHQASAFLISFSHKIKIETATFPLWIHPMLG